MTASRVQMAAEQPRSREDFLEAELHKLRAAVRDETSWRNLIYMTLAVVILGHLVWILGFMRSDGLAVFMFWWGLWGGYASFWWSIRRIFKWVR